MKSVKTFMVATATALCLSATGAYAESKSYPQGYEQYREYRAPMKKTDHQPENRQYQKNHQYQYQDQYGNRYDNRHQNQYDNRYDNRHQDQYGNRYNNPRRYPNDGNMNKRFIDDKRKDNNVHWHATPPAQQAKLNASQLQTVQRRLRNAGHAVSVDGKWGPATARAVRDFQRQQGLNVTGSLDQKTLAALDISNTPSRNR